MSKQVDDWGRVTIDPAGAFELALRGIDVWSVAMEDSPVLEQYNQLCERFDKGRFAIDLPVPHANTPEEEHARRAANWLISDEIRSIPVRDFLLSLCGSDAARNRVNHEMDLFEQRDLIPLLQLMMYLVDHMRRHRIVWGVGRGSSVASYCLFLIGVHKIDSLKYDLNVAEFLK